jgi:Xaa-Pro aminopeptidase
MENMMVVTEDGCEILDQIPRDHIIEPAHC